MDTLVHCKRRVSPRLQNIPPGKRPCYGSPLKKSLDCPENRVISKKTKICHSTDKNLPNLTKENEGENGFHIDSISSISNDAMRSPHTKVENIKSAAVKVNKEKGANKDSSLTDAFGKSSHAMVKETLRAFNKHYLHFVQEEEKRCTEVKITKDSTNKKVDACGKDVKQPSKRPDLKAISKMLETKAIMYPQKRFGHLPGVDVGHQFFSRAEMVAVGFHSHWLNGIDFMGSSYSKMKEYDGYAFPLAVAIVLSGQYEDDEDNSEDVVYTGQGGHDLLGNKRQVKDQVMARGNLALKNSMEHSVPVRVIRGHECANSYCGKVYTYDGLYKVVQYWAEKGVAGFTVFKYRLRRLEGQPELKTSQVQFIRGRASRVTSELPGLVCEDICQDQEDICIPVTNLFDDSRIEPADFTYSKSIQVSENVSLPTNLNGCNCKGTCTNANSCACARLNGSDFPYVRRDGGRLIEARDVVFECGPKCGCGPGCANRTSQRGLRYRLEVFRTPDKGWAVRSWDFIPSGAPVCEYVGVIKRTDDVDNVVGNDYIFEIDCWQTMNGIGARERRLRDVSLPTSNCLDKTEDKIAESVPEFCIDAGISGNIARFINHSCEPNLFVQCVLSSHHDIRLARIVLFAADNIPPLQELTYDYGYELDSVIGPDGKIRELACHCGADGCRKRLY